MGGKVEGGRQARTRTQKKTQFEEITQINLYAHANFHNQALNSIDSNLTIIWVVGTPIDRANFQTHPTLNS